MANMLREDENIKEEGREINVIAKQITVEKDFSLQLIVIALYLIGVVIAGLGFYLFKNTDEKIYLGLILIGIVMIISIYKKIKTYESYFYQLEQRLQQSSSQIDNYLEQRVIVLQNTAKLVEKSIDLDKTVFSDIAKLRTGHNINDIEKNNIQSTLDNAYRSLNLTVENYPDLKSHSELKDAMQQNMYLQREITAAREVYNDNVGIWNREIFEWPLKKYVAGKKEYTTRIPFIASKEIKERAKEVFF